MRLRDIEAITFDCYGTLIDWGGGAQQTLRELLTRRGERADEEAFFQAWERAQRARLEQRYTPYRQIAAEAFAEAAAAQGLSLGEEDARAFADSIPTWKPFPDTLAALARLKRKFKLGIISNIDDDILAETVRHLGVGFDLLMTAEQARAYKPSPAPFQQAIEKLGLAPERIAHTAFGFEYDIATAAQLGLRTILVRRTRSRFPSMPVPDLTVADLGELAAHFG